MMGSGTGGAAWATTAGTGSTAGRSAGAAAGATTAGAGGGSAARSTGVAGAVVLAGGLTLVVAAGAGSDAERGSGLVGAVAIVSGRGAGESFDGTGATTAGLDAASSVVAAVGGALELGAEGVTAGGGGAGSG
jgi:hypothetical protein